MASMDSAVPLMFPTIMGTSLWKTPQQKKLTDEVMTAANAKTADTR